MASKVVESLHRLSWTLDHQVCGELQYWLWQTALQLWYARITALQIKSWELCTPAIDLNVPMHV